MAWSVEFTDEFASWWNDLSEPQQIAVDAGVHLLESCGPALGYPHSSDVRGSRHGHMRELRVQCEGRRCECSTPLIRVASPFCSSVATRLVMDGGTSAWSHSRIGSTTSISPRSSRKD